MQLKVLLQLQTLIFWAIPSFFLFISFFITLNNKKALDLAGTREDTFRREIRDLRAKLESSELRNEQLSEELAQATKPLLRQIAVLQVCKKKTLANSNKYKKKEKKQEKKRITTK